MEKINKFYVSDVDKKLKEFDAAYLKSESQDAEIKKYQRIYQLRDKKNLRED